MEETPTKMPETAIKRYQTAIYILQYHIKCTILLDPKFNFLKVVVGVWRIRHRGSKWIGKFLTIPVSSLSLSLNGKIEPRLPSPCAHVRESFLRLTFPETNLKSLMLRVWRKRLIITDQNRVSKKKHLIKIS